MQHEPEEMLKKANAAKEERTLEGEQKVKLFREKSLEAIESPESLNDYLRVTSAGVWLVLAAVIALLTGLILWGIFGRIENTVTLAVSSDNGRAVCYVPYDVLEPVMSVGAVTVKEKSYMLILSEDADVETVSETMNPYIRLAGNLQIGDTTVVIPLDRAPEDGIYPGTVITESLQPIALLLQK